MVACTHCNSTNALDSRFCRNCGLGLPEDSLKEALGKNEAAVQEGYKLFHEGRTEEAMLLAEDAVETNPSSASGRSLLAMCQERYGQIAEALENYEAVLRINPDAPLEKIKVKQLRQLLSKKGIEMPAADRKRAMIGAAAAVVLVAAAGGIIGTLNTRSAVAQEKNLVASNDQPNMLGFGSQDVNSSVGMTNQQPNGNSNPPQVNTPIQGDNRVANPPITYTDRPGLPQVDIRGSIDPGQTPVTIDPGTLGLVPNQPSGGDPAIDPKPGPEQPDNGAAQTPREEEKKEKPSVIEIKVRDGNSLGGGQPVNGGGANQIEALSRTAQSQMLAGNWAAAANSYKKLLDMGGDTATISQRLAQCYEKLGKKTDALNSYMIAISALEITIQSGRGNSATKSALESCKQAVKALRG